MDSVQKFLRTSVRRLSFLFPEHFRRKLLFEVFAPYREKELPFLGKSAFQTGQHCELQLWKSVKDPSSDPDFSNQYISPKQKSLLREIANRLYPEAKHAGYKNSITREMLSKGLPVRGACIRTDFFDVRADFILPNEGGWEILIVKASSSAKRSHVSELSFIRMVLEEAGFKIVKTGYFIINSGYYFVEGEVDPNRLFHHKDCSVETEASLGQTKEKAYRLLEILEKEKLPSRSSVKHCDHPRNCSFPNACYADDPPGDLFTLREGKEITYQLWNQGIRNLSEAEINKDFTGRQKIQIEAVRSGKEYLNSEALNAFLNKLRFPLYFLDFETINPPVPVYSRTNPFQHVPFLYSLHVLQENLIEEPKEYHYLDENVKDPRLGILESLSSQIQPGGTVIAFNDNFEKRCLKEASDAFPEYKKWYQSIEPDFIDLAKPFWDYDYYHPDQKGTTSLKTVLPVLTGADYKDLSIHAGHTANAEFLRIKTEPVNPEERSKVEADLIAYCKMDTFALILILRKLAEKLDWHPK
ncbi:DUF2779 domain-containing protein [Leptospira semungkisensis]|uniref:DUF2779 domain-containing protein n=1 Tax=Leptospira semungkisensis TaxID=2484985 RepID=A0A4R9G707_9LEPT|nr:DUF2779 domain-containing protein [Leptospira semungkisensis]TGK07314.1 DUF2779 domain-containing protein [Leptospira semungkisensis]